MGMLVDGIWQDGDVRTPAKDGSFKRRESSFRDRVSDAPDARFRPEPGRYHLYVSLACPWAHRTLLMRKLKGLEHAITVSVVDPFMGEDGWWFSDGPGCVPDTVNRKDKLHEVYTLADPGYTGKVTVPVLWDKREGTIVNNESSEIVRMFNSAFAGIATRDDDWYPKPLRAEIDAVNERIYETVNNGVYRAGFARTQDAYEAAFDALFATLDDLEDRLAAQRYLVGDRMTEADLRLFPTLLRFDPVYHGHFKCNQRRLVDYPNLWAYTREIYQIPGVAETVNLDHIKRHYYESHESVNPTRIVPKGPAIDLTAPHGRDRLPAAA